MADFGPFVLFYIKEQRKAWFHKALIICKLNRWLHFSARGNWAYRNGSGKPSLYKTVHFAVLIASSPQQRESMCVCTEYTGWIQRLGNATMKAATWVGGVTVCDLRVFNLLLDYNLFLSLDVDKCTCRPVYVQGMGIHFLSFASLQVKLHFCVFMCSIYVI